MARRGVFGRVPRAVPSLTATIISIAEQMLADQDRNIMDAWQNGGLYEGKPVTDKMVLDHWQQRLRGVSRNDPLYDTYKNNVLQLQYRIAYSKKYTAYLQGGRTDNMGMAEFFTDWAKKVPRNSEFYRQLQQDAAGYVNLARSAARAGAAQAKVENFNRRRADIERQYIRPATIVNDALTQYARANGLIGNNQSLEAMQAGQVAVFYDMLANSDANTFLYNGPGGQPITVGDIRQQVHKVAPDLRFGFTAEDINRINLRAVKGSTMGVRLARANGYEDWTAHYQTQRNIFGGAARDSGIMSVEDQYVQLRETFNVEFNDPNSGVEDKAKAWDAYRNGLSLLAGQSTDPNTRARLGAEANGDSTQNSLAEDVFGLGGPPGTVPDELGTPPSSVGDIANTQMQIKLVEEQRQLATDGTGVWTTGFIDEVKNPDGRVVGYQFTPSANGTAVGLTDNPAVINKLLALDATGNPTGPTVTLPSDWGGLKDVRLELIPVYAVNVGTATQGNDAPGTLVAHAATITINGVQQTSYLYSNGGQTWKTPFAPWDPSFTVTHKDGSIEIDARNLNVTGPNAARIASQHPEAFALTIAGLGRVDASTVTYNADGTINTVVDPGTGKVVTVGPGQLAQALVTDVKAAVYASDPTRATGPNPTEDFKTWTQAMLTANPGGQQTYDKMAQDKGFQDRLAAEIATNSNDVTGLPNRNVQAAATLQAFGSMAFPGAGLVAKLVAGTPQGQALFNWFINQPIGGDVNAGPAEAVIHAAPKPQALQQSAASVAQPTPPPIKPAVAPSLASLGAYANSYLGLARLGLVPQPTTNPANVSAQQSVQIAPVDIKVPAPPPPQPIPQPAPPPVPVNGGKAYGWVTKAPYINPYHAGQGGQ